jgi:tetratricopeptide (TPR) repeat protein
MRHRASRHVRHLVHALACIALLGMGTARAQPVIDAVLSDAQLATRNGCAILQINFNVRIRYSHHFPLDHGSELQIALTAIDRNQLVVLQLLRREAVRPPGGRTAGIMAIDFETRPAIGSVLSIHFERPVFYRVAQSADIQSIIVAISGSKPNAACKPELAGGGNPTVLWRHAQPSGPVAADSRPMARPPGQISDADLRSAAAAMDEARAALAKKDFNGAIALLTKVLRYPENKYSAEAQELIGLARQRSGQADAARAAYEDYLRRYPRGEGAERVQQRLAGLVTASGESGEKLRTPRLLGTPPLGSQFEPAGATTWSFAGSVSQFYIRDDSFQVARDASAAPNPNEEADAHQVHQNQMLTSLDLTAAWNNPATKGKIRFSGTNELPLGSDRPDRFGVAALFSEISIKDWDVFARAGRQVRNTDGVLGRFDGGLASWQAVPWAKLNVVAGSPVLTRFDLPFRDDKFFYGVSAGFGPFFGGLEASVYAIEQRARSLIDRQAVGAELRYFDLSKTGFLTVDYDVHFQQLNAAIFSGSWTLPDKSTIYGGADYRKTPFLSTWNALLNQPFVTLYDMLRLQTREELQQLAINQTPTYRSAMIGYSRPLNDHFQVSADATVVNLTQPLLPSLVDPGLPSLPAGNEYYLSTQLMGSNLITDGDMYIAGVRYSRLLDSNLYVLDFNTRYPLFKELAISPRLRLGYRAGRGIDLKEYTAVPSLLIDYYWTRQLSFEFEGGVQRTWGEQFGFKDDNLNVFLTFGLRYDFYTDDTTRADDKRKCATPVAAALCRYSNGVGNGSCAAPPTGCR